MFAVLTLGTIFGWCPLLPLSDGTSFCPLLVYNTEGSSQIESLFSIKTDVRCVHSGLFHLSVFGDQ